MECQYTNYGDKGVNISKAWHLACTRMWLEVAGIAADCKYGRYHYYMIYDSS